MWSQCVRATQDILYFLLSPSPHKVIPHLSLRDGSNAMDHQLGDISPVGKEHRECLRRRSQLDLQHPGVPHLPPPGSVLHLLWSVSVLQKFEQTNYLLFFTSVEEREGDCRETIIISFFINPSLLSSVPPVLIQHRQSLCNHPQQMFCNILSSLPYVKTSKEVTADWYPEVLPTSSIPPQSMCLTSRFLLRQEGTDLSWSWWSIHQGWLWRSQVVNDRFQMFIRFIRIIHQERKTVSKLKKHNDAVIKMVMVFSIMLNNGILLWQGENRDHRGQEISLSLPVFLYEGLLVGTLVLPSPP